MEYVKLEDVFELQMGKTPSRNNPKYWDGTKSWVSISDMGESKYIEKTREKISDTAILESGIKPIPDNTVIMSFKLSIGKTAITKGEMYSNEAIMAFIDKQTRNIDVEYMYYLLSSVNWRESTNKAVKGLTLNKATLSKKTIRIPSCDEQKKVVIRLNKLNNLIIKQRKQLEKLDELVKSRFVEMFGGIHNSTMYKYRKVKDFTDVISGGTPNREMPDYWQNGSIPWVKTTELQNTVIRNTEECITDRGLSESSAKIVPPQTVLIAMYGQGKTRGMTGFLDISACTNQACACILPSNDINPIYLWKYFVLSYDNLRNLAKGGNQPNLNGNIIKNYPVLFPPLDLQHQFAAFVEQIDKSKLAVKQALEKAELLKKALMQKYFG